jgi:hypothetical protein
MMQRIPLIAVCLAFLLLSACQPAPTPKAAAATIKVNLPSSPPMTEPAFVEKYVDGHYTVAGLIRGRAKLLNTDVRVKGYVQTSHLCPPKEAPCDPPPHAILVDDLLRPHKRLIVIGGVGADLSALQEKQVVTLEGRYLQSDPAGLFIRMEGLLLLQPQEGEEEAPPRGRRGKRKRR